MSEIPLPAQGILLSVNTGSKFPLIPDIRTTDSWKTLVVTNTLKTNNKTVPIKQFSLKLEIQCLTNILNKSAEPML